MNGNASDDEYEDIDWNTDDELEINGIAPSSFVLENGGAVVSNGAVVCNGEASSSAGPSNSKVVQHFLGMGFTEQMIAKAIAENGEAKTELILNSLLSYVAIEESRDELNSGAQQQHCVDSSNGQLSSDYDEGVLDDLSESDSWSWSGSEVDDIASSLPKHEKVLRSLTKMGYAVEVASAAIDRCGPEASITELTDFILAAQMAKTEDVFYEDEKPKISRFGDLKKRKFYELEMKKKRKALLTEDDEVIRLPKPMIGFGTPNDGPVVTHRKLPEEAIGPPFFYYENVALAPKGVWDTISRFLYDIQPEFVDSKYFCAAARKRGYIHNLPIKNRFPLFPLPPRTINDALPLTKKWWPKWDTRTKLNCLQTCIGSAKLTERIRKALEECGEDHEPPLHVQKYVMDQCKKWNLVWVGKNKVAPLEADEVEMLLGFPRNHTRGGGISRTDRYKSLGNSFQVDTVAYHLSVLKEIFPNGLNMLSLFSGIGGAEVALHRLGIPLKNVVSVEISRANRDIVRSWWEQTNQKGNLIHLDDVQQLNGDQLERYMGSFGGFDLIVGGSPCNNLAGSNRVSRDGLEGEHSSLFYDYFRILDLVKCIMKGQQ
uniref:DNA (cytosine-5)-methyltransferase DRM2-like n=1 Tax=Erigeron canadensis TaxID=72917 RepID=UPI001CB9C4D1|nr:DNA (cytosine-5)-methyltransferase DRM2-like [Erigeron canadensis]